MVSQLLYRGKGKLKVVLVWVWKSRGPNSLANMHCLQDSPFTKRPTATPPVPESPKYAPFFTKKGRILLWWRWWWWGGGALGGSGTSTQQKYGASATWGWGWPRWTERSVDKKAK